MAEYFSMLNYSATEFFYAYISIFMLKQGSRPVVFFSLKGIQGPDYQLMQESMQEFLRRLYGQLTL